MSIDDVGLVLSSIDPSKSMVPDNIHPHLLKAYAQELAYPLTLVYQASLDAGSLPSMWKQSFVVPVFKKRF